MVAGAADVDAHVKVPEGPKGRSQNESNSQSCIETLHERRSGNEVSIQRGKWRNYQCICLSGRTGVTLMII